MIKLNGSQKDKHKNLSDKANTIITVKKTEHLQKPSRLLRRTKKYFPLCGNKKPRYHFVLKNFISKKIMKPVKIHL